MDKTSVCDKIVSENLKKVTDGMKDGSRVEFTAYNGEMKGALT